MVEWGNCPDRFDSYFSFGDIVGSIPTFCTNRLDDSDLKTLSLWEYDKRTHHKYFLLLCGKQNLALLLEAWSNGISTDC